MLGDGHCDEACYSLACGWDGLDCGCAPDCRQSEYGSCKAQCLVPDCNYDHMNGFPQCANEDLRKAALYFHLTVGNFSIPYSYADICAANTPSCSFSKWSDAATLCVSDCNMPSCALSKGNCLTAGCSVTPRNCANCGVGTSRGCLSCKPGFLHFYRACVASCPVHFHPHPLIPDVCFPDTDTSTAGLPFTFHVSNVSNPSGTGSIDDPFDSISLALAGCVFKYCRVELSPGQHNLTIVTPSAYLHTWTQYAGLLPFLPTGVHLTVTKAACVNKCSNPVILYDNLNAVQVTVPGIMEISGVDWSAKSTMVAGCEDPFCFYCATMSVSASGAGTDDQGIVHAPNTFAQSRHCSRFKYFSLFILAPSASLSIRNCSISDFLQGLSSLFTMKSGYLSLENLSMSNITIASAQTLAVAITTITNAIIQQNSSNSALMNTLGTTYEPGAILLKNVTVTQINNGFELLSGLSQFGLMAINGIRTVAIVNCTFSQSIVQGGTFISAMTFRTFQIDNCVFSSIYTEAHFIRLNPTGILAYQPQTGGRPDDYYLDHISITNTNFTSVSCVPRTLTSTTGSLLYLSPMGQQMNILLENLQFRWCLSSGNILMMTRPSVTATDAEKSGTKFKYNTGTERITIILPQIWCRLKKITIRNTYAGLNLILAYRISNLELREMTVQNSSDSRGVASANTQTISRLIGRPGIYLTKPLTAAALPSCVSPITTQSLYNITVFDFLLRNSSCQRTFTTTTGGGNNEGNKGIAGLGGFVGVVNTGPLYMDGVEISEEIGPGLGGAMALQYQSSGAVYLTRFRVINVISGGPTGLVTIVPTNFSETVIAESLFQGGQTAAALIQITAASAITIVSSKFVDNNAKTQSMVYFLPGVNVTLAGVTIVGSEFTRNNGGDGTAIYLTNILSAPIPIKLTISSTIFSENLSSGDGVAVYIDSKTALDDQSVIYNCSFIGNKVFEAVISLNFLSGGLTIDFSRFSNNTAVTVSAVLVAQQVYTPATPTFVAISRSVFTDNNATALIKAANPSGYERLICTDNHFSGNFMPIFEIDRGLITDSASVYDRNFGSAFRAVTSSVINITDSVFAGGHSVTGAAINLGGGSALRCINCVFRDNYASSFGGALFVEQSAVVTAVNCSFLRNSAKERGSAGYFFGSQANSVFTGSVFEENYSGDSGTIVAISSAVRFDMVVFRRNTAMRTAGITAYFSFVEVNRSSFIDHTNLSSPFIYSALETSFRISDCVFQGVETTSDGGIVYALSSVLMIKASKFTGLRATSGALLLAAAGAEFWIEDSEILDAHTSDVFGGVISATAGSGSVSDTQFTNYSSGGIFASEMTRLTLTRVTFSSGVGVTGGAVYCSGCSEISLASSVFDHLTAVKGAAVYLSSSTRHTSTHTMLVTDCQFRDLRSTEAALLLDNVHASILSSLFENCSSQGSEDSNGGAVSMRCASMPGGCDVIVDSCRFIGNSADLEGGSIHWHDSMPDIRNSTFVGGSAIYGNDVASFPISLHIAFIHGNASIQSVPSFNSSEAYEATLFDLASGQLASQVIELWLLDHYGQKVATQTEGSASLSSNNSGTSLIGDTSANIVNGTFTFKDFGVTARPESVTYFAVSTSVVDTSKKRGSLDNRTYSNSIQIKVVMRACRMGESDFKDQCAICPAGKYSLSPKISCQDCPSAAICYGNFTMVPKASYWRSSVDTDVFWKCPFEKSCIGSPEPPAELSLMGDCEVGYYGNLCNGCLTGFSRMNQAECGRCPSYTVNIVRTVGIGGAMLIFLILVVATAIRSAYRSQSYFSIYIKILMNYLQLVMWTVSFDLSWPSYMLELFKAQQSAGNITDQVFSIDCFFTQNGKDDQANAVRLKIVILSFLPVIMCLLGALFWLPYAAIARKCSYLKNELVTTSVVFFFLIHPSLVKFMFDFLNCRQLDPGQYWMNSYLNIRCWDDVHTRFAITVAVPSIIVWGVGLPSLCLIILTRYKLFLNQTKFRLRLGFIYNGYEPQKFYWELIILYRKIIIISIAVFIANISIYVQALSAMLVIMVALALQSKNKPYVVPAMNELEIRAIFVGGVTIYSGMYCMSRSLDHTSEVVLFILIVVVNCYFLGYWTKKVAAASWVILKKKCAWVARILGRSKYRVNPRGADTTGVPQKSPSLEFIGMSRDMSDEHPRDVSFSRVPMAPSNSAFDLAHIQNNPLPVIAHPKVESSVEERT